MCYYNNQKVTRAEYIRLKQLEREVKRYNFLDPGVFDGFLYPQIAALLPNKDHSNFDIVQLEWGFIPQYIKDREESAKMRNGHKNPQGKWIEGKPNLNAKAENLFISATTNKESIFADAARNGRCLILSTGFFEYRHFYKKHQKTGRQLESTESFPYYITLKDQPYFYMAGVHQEWTDKKTGEVADTAAILTTEANKVMRQIHNMKGRMPTILNDELAWRWLMEDLSEGDIMEIAATQYDWNQLEYCTVGKDFKIKLEPEEKFSYASMPELDLSLEAPAITTFDQQTSLF
jgi:putative SOS response-associated peptidase YedK